MMGLRSRDKKGAGPMRTWAAALVFSLGLAISAVSAGRAWAMDAGTYLVTVTPSYTDPESGRIEDPGNNEAIGQGMTQKLCGPQGLLEVDGTGNMYLTVRYYLSQFVSDVSFEERNGGSYSSCSWERMQVKDPVSGSSNLDEKYGYTDYRIPIGSLDSVFRGKAYIEPMGRNVVYFFTAGSPVPGSGDFVTSIRTQAEEAPAAEVQAGEAAAEPEPVWEDFDEGMETGSPDEGLPEADEYGGADAENRMEESRRDARENGSGDADAPVTGIPAKPSGRSGAAAAGDRAAGKSSTVAGGNAAEYRLETSYDLSQVPIKEARKLTEPILKEATGITMTVGDRTVGAAAKDSGGGGQETQKSTRESQNRTVMLVLLGISAVLGMRFAAGTFFTGKRREKL